MKARATVEAISLNFSPENLKVDPISKQAYDETWPIRREQFRQDKKGILILSEITTEKWLEITQEFPVVILADGTFLHNFSVHQEKRYIKYNQIVEFFGGRLQAFYYGSCNRYNKNLISFFEYLRSLPRFQVFEKLISSNNKAPVNYSLGVEFTIAALTQAYNNTSLKDILILSRDPELVPLIKELKELDIRVTICRARNVPTDRNLLTEAHHVMDLNEFLQSINAYSENDNA